jgi:riboflavin synthase
MFTGLIEEVGVIRSVARRGDYARIGITAPRVGRDLAPGDSVAIEGACQTVVERKDDTFAVDSLASTLSKTTFGSLRPGSRVNLERALRADGRLDGHIVAGHVGGVATVISLRRDGANTFLSLTLPPHLASECVPEGSIAVAGVSLTIADISRSRIRLNIIPETLRRTTLGDLFEGATVNVETDIIGRYVRRLLGSVQSTNLTAERLAEWGYTGGRA